MSKKRTIYAVVELAGADYVENLEKVLCAFSSEAAAKFYADSLNDNRDKSIEAMNKVATFTARWDFNHRHIPFNVERSVLFRVAKQDFIELSGISMVDLESYYDLYDRVFDIQEIEFEEEE